MYFSNNKKKIRTKTFFQCRKEEEAEWTFCISQSYDQSCSSLAIFGNSEVEFIIFFVALKL